MIHAERLTPIFKAHLFAVIRTCCAIERKSRTTYLKVESTKKNNTYCFKFYLTSVLKNDAKLFSID